MTDTREKEIKSTLENYLPHSVVDEVYGYIVDRQLRLKITQGRKSKLGDYRWPQVNHPGHEISVNGDLNPYMFLMVLIHEMAHLENYLSHRNTVKPHGHEWQEKYQQILEHYLLIEGAFPKEAIPLMERLCRRKPLSITLRREVEEILKRENPDYDPGKHQMVKELEKGNYFALKSHPSLVFELGDKRRTRFFCKEISNGRIYLVPGDAEVAVVYPEEKK